MSDEEAAELLIGHRYFRPHVTPIQLLNRATDPMLPKVKPHTFEMLRLLDGRGLTNSPIHRIEPSLRGVLHHAFGRTLEHAVSHAERIV